MAKKREPQTVANVLDWFAVADQKRYQGRIAIKERKRVRDLFKAAYGDFLVEDLRPADLLAFIQAQAGSKSNWTKRRIKATVNRPFNFAAQLGMIDRNPFSGLPLPLGTCGRDWTQSEFQAALRSCSPYFRRLIIFCRFSGARPGEARTLEWNQISYADGVIVQDMHKNAWREKGPRRIYLNRILVKLLKWMARHPAHDTLVFVNNDGTSWTIKSLVNHFNLIRKRAGLSKEVKLHGLRHTHATGAIMKGLDVAIVGQLLGHHSLASTQIYLHLASKSSFLNEAAERAV